MWNAINHKNVHAWHVRITGRVFLSNRFKILNLIGKDQLWLLGHSHQIHLSLQFRGVAWETRYEGSVAHHSHCYVLEH